MQVDSYLPIAILVLVISLPILVPSVLRRRAEKARGPLIEDPEALALAEAAVAEIDLQKELADRGFVYVDDFSSDHAFSKDYMDKMTLELKSLGMETHYIVINQMQRTEAYVEVYRLYGHVDQKEDILRYLARRFRDPS